MLIDTHCHLDLVESFGLNLDIILNHSIENDVNIIVQIAVDKNSCLWNKQFIDKYYQNPKEKLKIYYTMGLHPESVKNQQQILEILELIKNNKKDPYFIGIGETGLDFFQNPETKEIQIESFYQHLKLAKELQLPIIVHCRDDKQYNETKLEAISLIHSIGKELNYPYGIMHCYTYSKKEAKWFIDLGWKISFSGILTFKNALFLQEAAHYIPNKNILIETDAPFLAPVPYRGKTNQPAYVKSVFEYLVKLKNLPEEILKNQLQKNSKEIFNKILL